MAYIISLVYARAIDIRTVDGAIWCLLLACGSEMRTFVLVCKVLSSKTLHGAVVVSLCILRGYGGARTKFCFIFFTRSCGRFSAECRRGESERAPRGSPPRNPPLSKPRTGLCRKNKNKSRDKKVLCVRSYGLSIREASIQQILADEGLGKQ